MALNFVKVVKQDSDRIIIRLPEGLHAKLKAAAVDTRKTMTAVAVSFIEAGLAKYVPGQGAQESGDNLTDEAIAALNEIIEKANSARSALAASKIKN